tara:strand:+ start:9175 stop:9918 length:744 start_codon:yes stop_codon:yes gene_type:complete
MSTTIATETSHLPSRSRVNQLLESASDLFSLTTKLRSIELGASIDDSFHQDVLSYFTKFEQRAREKNISNETISEAKYALAAFIDELVLSSAWPGRKAWMSKTLQWKFFNEHVAGEGFFKHLASLRQGGETNLQLIELYYVCIQLGFEGLYRMRGMEARQALLVDVKAQIDGYRRAQDNVLSGNSIIKKSIMTKVGQHIPYWSIASITIALVFFIYSGFSLAIHSHADHTVKELQTYQAQLLQRVKG